MTPASQTVSHGRGERFLHGEEIIRASLRTGDTVILSAHHGGFRTVLVKGMEQTEMSRHTDLDSAILQTREMVHHCGGSPQSPDIESFAVGEIIHSEDINNYQVVMQKRSGRTGTYWSVYAVRHSDDAVSDRINQAPDAYLIALNDYDQLYFDIEAGKSPEFRYETATQRADSSYDEQIPKAQ